MKLQASNDSVHAASGIMFTCGNKKVKKSSRRNKCVFICAREGRWSDGRRGMRSRSYLVRCTYVSRSRALPIMEQSSCLSFLSANALLSLSLPV